MYLTLLIVLLLPLFSEPASLTIRCKPPAGLQGNNEKIRRQRTYIRNPNYKLVNEELDRIAKSMYITELPLPHPGAQAGSSHGCEEFESDSDG